MKRKLLLIILITISFALMVLGRNTTSMTEVEGVFINEIIPDNFSLKSDGMDNYFDIVELYNNSGEAISLLDYGLSDDPDVLHKWKFPDIVIESDQYLLVYLAGDAADGLSLVSDDLYCDFKMSSLGEKLILTDDQGEVLSSLSYQRIKTDMSYGKTYEGYTYFLRGTPGYYNEGTTTDNVDILFRDFSLKPSLESGIYDEPQSLAFEDKYNGKYQIRYTLDCSNPDFSSALYSEPIQIDYTDKLPIRISNIPTSYYPMSELDEDEVNKGLVIKAQYFDGEVPIGDRFVGTYFIWEEGSDRYSLDLVSLTAVDSNLFSSYNGIFVVGDYYAEQAPDYPDGGTPANYNQRGRDWEKAASVEFFNSDGELKHLQGAGLRITGNWSRAYNKKSLKIYAREGYGSDVIDYEVFEGLNDINDENITSFDELIFRTGGNDYNQLIFRDLLGDSIAPDGLDYQAYKPVILFINGEYFGIYNIRESMDESYLSAHYDKPEDKFSIIKYVSHVAGLYAGEDTELARYQKLEDFIVNEDLSLEDNYRYVESMVDIDNLIDYYLTEMFVHNTDWVGGNLKLWRYTGQPEAGKLDGRYRYLLYDLDFAFSLFGDYDSVKRNPFDFIEGHGDQVYLNLIENVEFREKVVVRLCDLLNSSFSSENIKQQIDSLYNIYENEIEENRARWKIGSYDSLESYEANELALVRDFAARRGDLLMEYAAEAYGLQAVGIELNSDNAVSVNDQRLSADSVRLHYFSGYPIHLEADENAGFDHWEIDSENYSVIDGDLYSESLTIVSEESMTVEAVWNK